MPLYSHTSPLAVNAKVKRNQSLVSSCSDEQSDVIMDLAGGPSGRAYRNGMYNFKPAYATTAGNQVQYSGNLWYYAGSGGEYAIANSGNEAYPWLATWPAGATASRSCPLFLESGPFYQTAPSGACNNITTPSGWNIAADSIHTYTDNKMQFNSAGNGETTFVQKYFFPYTADSTSPYNGTGWPAVQFQQRIGLPATPVFDGSAGSMCRITWNNMVIFEQTNGNITTNMGYYVNGNATSILQNVYSGSIPYSYAQAPATIPATYFMNFKIESVNSSLEFEIGFLWD